MGSSQMQIPSNVNPTNTAKNAYFGLADVIQRSATAVVAEFAQMEIEAEREARRWRRERGYYSDDEEEETSRNGLPWEVSATEIDEELKLKILALSCNDKTFYGPFDNNNTNTDDLTNKSETEETSAAFDLDSHASLIRKLLTTDSNLADAHARLSGSKIKEHVFWHNHFYHCLKTQIDHRSNDNPTTNQKQQSTTQSNDNNL